MHQAIILLVLALLLSSCSKGEQSSLQLELETQVQHSQTTQNFAQLRASIQKLENSDNEFHQQALTEVRDSLADILDNEDEQFIAGSGGNIKAGLDRLNEVISILSSISSSDPKDFDFIFGYNLELFSQENFDQMLSVLESENRKSNLAADFVLMQFLRKQIDDRLFVLPSFDKKNIIGHFTKRLEQYQRDERYHQSQNQVVSAFYPLLELDGSQYTEELYIALFSFINSIDYSGGLSGLAKISYQQMLTFLNTRNFNPSVWNKLDAFSYRFMNSLNSLLEIKVAAFKANPTDVNLFDEIDQILTVLDASGTMVNRIDLKKYFRLKEETYFLLEEISKAIAENKIFLELNQKNCALNLAIYKARVLSSQPHADSFTCSKLLQTGDTAWDRIRTAFITSEELKTHFAASKSIDPQLYEKLKQLTIETLALVDGNYLDFKLNHIYRENFSNLQDVERLKKLNEEVILETDKDIALNLGSIGVDSTLEAGVYYYSKDLTVQLSGNVTFHPFSLILAPGHKVHVIKEGPTAALSNLWIDVTGIQSLQSESNNYDRYFSLPNPVSKMSGSRWVIDWHGLQNELMNIPAQNSGKNGGDSGSIVIGDLSLLGNSLLMARGGHGGEGAVEPNERTQRPSVAGLRKTTDRCFTFKGDPRDFGRVEERYNADGVEISVISTTQGHEDEGIIEYCLDEFVTITFPELKKGKPGVGGTGGEIDLSATLRAGYSSIVTNTQEGNNWSDK